MDKEEYLRLLRQASIADTSKFTPIDPNRPKTRGRPSKHFHPLLQKEKELKAVHIKFFLRNWLNRYLPKVPD